MRVELGRLMIVTDRRAAEAAGREVVEAVQEALGALGPADALVQLREKDLPAGDLLALGRRLHPVSRERRCPLLVNDRVDVALAVGAEGVHLPEQGIGIAISRRLARMPDFLIGRSVHDADAAGAAARDGADVIVCGPVWDTPSKRGRGEPIGLDALEAAARAVREANPDARLYAIGGVENEERVRLCRERGAYGVAAIRAFMAAPAEAAASFAAACAAADEEEE